MVPQTCLFHPAPIWRMLFLLLPGELLPVLRLESGKSCHVKPNSEVEQPRGTKVLQQAQVCWLHLHGLFSCAH